MPEENAPREDETAAGGNAPGAAAAGAGSDGSLPIVDPDAMEEVNADEIDNIVPAFGYHELPIVALGGSAGSIQALKTFLQTQPPGAGAAYVVIVHLSPEHESTLPAILQTVTVMPVTSACNGEEVEAGHVYVIPPGMHLTVINGHLKLTPLEPERGRRVAVDLFFRSLADTHGPHATAIVLSGADGDGANGLKRIKERGGLTIAQDPDEAEYDGMPRSAIATGMVDWVLPVANMPARIRQYRDNETRLRLPAEEGLPPARPMAATLDEDEQALREVLAFLRSRTSHDFTYYKRATILRRVSRRMQINTLTTLPHYLTFLRTHPGEAGALLQDLLISVTNFFRDRDAFEAVEKEIPTLFEGKGPGDVVRVWCAACASGEEVYSFAMLLVEHARTLENPPALQVFGCDLDAQAIQIARAGVYPPSIVADVSETRLQRFFTRDPRGYRVRRELREMVLFAEHDLLKDAPFSRMSLISCRNLLIYLDREAQERAMQIFHFALQPEGRLFLGNSETVDESKGLFTALDKKHRIYLRRPAPRQSLPVPVGTATLLRTLRTQSAESPVVVPSTAFNRGVGVPFTSPAPPAGTEDRAALADLHFRMLERLAPPSVVIDAQMGIVHLSEHAGRFLQVAGGPPTSHLLRMVNPALRIDLHAAIFRVMETNRPVDVSDVPVQFEGVPRMVDLHVMPAPELAPGHLVITFEEHDPGAAVATDVPRRLEADSVVRHLEREVESLRGKLRDTVERYEASTEEYRASNEELQAMNEELRSASEELETSREELQSINEELGTVNLEYKSRVEEIGQINADLQNFMSATDIATVFLDRDLKVMRYTPASVGFFNLIPGDLGRPLADLKFRVEYPELISDAQAVLRHLVPVEREVGKADGGWFLARLLPYRTTDDHIGGVVLTLVDITARKRAEEAAHRSLQEAEQARGEAEAANRSKDQFLAVLSHELRTPLTPVVMALEMLSSRADLPEMVRDALEMIRRNVRIETHFIDDLLDMTRISRGKMEIVRKDADLHEAVRYAVEISTPDLVAKEQSLAVHLDATEHRLSGDSARLQQVFWNLLKNASKFTPERGKITLRSRSEPGRVVVEVTDTGIGLAPAAVERIFKPFEQADGTIAGEFGGLGLGLAIAKATVEAHGGELSACSPGRHRGTTFTVSLPLTDLA